MIHVLHLPSFPEGSKINPAYIQPLLIETDVSCPDSTAHIVLNTANSQHAKSWALSFLQKNTEIAFEDTSLTKCDVTLQDIHAKLIQIPFSYTYGSDIVSAYYCPKQTLKQEFIALK